MLPIRDLCATAFCVCPLFFTEKNHKYFRYILPRLRCSFRVSSIDVATALRPIRVIARWRNGRCRAECGNVEGSEGRCKRPSGVRGGARSKKYVSKRLTGSNTSYRHIDDFPLNGHPPSITLLLLAWHGVISSTTYNIPAFFIVTILLEKNKKHAYYLPECGIWKCP